MRYIHVCSACYFDTIEGVMKVHDTISQEYCQLCNHGGEKIWKACVVVDIEPGNLLLNREELDLLDI